MTMFGNVEKDQETFFPVRCLKIHFYNLSAAIRKHLALAQNFKWFHHDWKNCIM